jgi:lipoyl(octanoyl) transferase
MDSLVSTGTTVQWRVSDAVVAYPSALTAMQEQAASIRAGSAEETVWLLQHPPLYTSGTSAQPGDLLNPQGFPTFAAGRGGQWTYHGPGQRTAYVMLDLTRRHGQVAARDVRAYVWGLEEWVILALDSLNVRAERRAGRVGIWVADAAGESKIAAIGVRVTRWVSWHGVAVNVSPDLGHFGGIVPCGIRDHGVTSLEALGHTATLEDVDLALRDTWPTVFE